MDFSRNEVVYMGRTIENAQWRQRRPCWYIELVQGKIPSQRRRHILKNNLLQSNSLDYGLIYGGLGEFGWVRMDSIPVGAKVHQRISKEEHDKLR